MTGCCWTLCRPGKRSRPHRHSSRAIQINLRHRCRRYLRRRMKRPPDQRFQPLHSRLSSRIDPSIDNRQQNEMMQTETFRREMPPPLQPRPLNLPETSQTKLANGLTLVLIEDKRLPLINFRLAFRSGDANDPASLPGLTDMMSHLVSEGTETRTSRQIAEEIERLGATLSIGSSSDFTTIAASSLSIYASEILELIADVTLRSTFPQSE